jgi:FAD/FMN-containing dehydrogenase
MATTVERPKTEIRAPGASTARESWRNWGGNQSCNPVAIERPASEAAIVRIVRAAAEAGEHVKVFGAGHSFTDIACTDGRMISLDRYNGLLDVDLKTRTVKVQAGITIEQLGAELELHGMAQPNLGDIGYQSIAGAVSTATHGTGRDLGNISTQIKAMSLVAGDGSIIECDAEREPDVFAAARVSLGALGVISTVTLQCVPAFTLRSVEEPKTLNEVLERFTEFVEGNDHFEFFWFPHTNVAQAIFNTRLVRFVEMEYAIPREAVVDTVREVNRMIDKSGMNISFPVEVRVAHEDDIPLSTATARPTAYIAVHVFHKLPFERYFREVEAIMNGVEGRPHWGKMHYQTAETLAPRYPQWDRFIGVRDRLDPDRRFANAYLERVLG